MSVDLPIGWEAKKFEDCVDILDSKRVPINGKEREQRISGKDENELIPYYGATGKVGFIDDYLFDQELLILGEDGVQFFESMRQKSYIIQGKSWVNNHAHVLNARTEITSNRFLRYYLNQFDFHGYVTGTTRLKLNQTKMKTIPVKMPLLPEQKRIADKLDCLLAKVDACKARLDKVPEIIKRFRQSVLANATSGRLTEDWRDSQGLNAINNSQKVPANWKQGKLGNYIKKIQAGKNFKCPEISVTNKTVGLVKISAVTWGKFNSKETKTVVDPEKIIPELFIKENDLLVSRANTIELVGASVIVGIIEHRIMLSDKVWRIDLQDINKAYVHRFLKSQMGRSEIESRATGNQQSMRNISQSAFKDIDINVPPKTEQKEIVKRVEALFSIADQMEKKLKKVQGRVDKLTASILAKAFRGELVPQNLNDEPAEKLLELANL